jgi:hypothetical protein
VEKGFGKMILQFTPDFENALISKGGLRGVKIGSFPHFQGGLRGVKMESFPHFQGGLRGVKIGSFPHF